MFHVGLDVHSKRSSLCILDDDGKQVKQFEVLGTWPELMDRVAREVPRPFAVCFEASCGYGYLHDQLTALAHGVTVAHPGQLRLIFRSKKKNDRVDAAKLAKLLYLDMVPRVHVPSVDVRSWRKMIGFRQMLVGKRVSVKNQIRALLRGLGITPPRSLWAKKGVAWLKERQLGELEDLQRDMLLSEMDGYTGQIKKVEKQLNKIAAGHPGVALLRTIPGVGIRTAESVVAYLDDVKRFSRIKQVGSYLGLVPCQDASAGKNRLGHITREGPSVVRKLLCEAAWQVVRRDPGMKAYFQRIRHDDPDRRKIAIVAVAHKLSRVMTSMLRSGEVYRKAAE